MASEDISLENKCENLMNVVVETRKRFGKMCVDYEQKTSAIEKKLLNLKIEAFSNYKFKPKNSMPTVQSDAAEIKEFADELMEMAKGFEDVRDRIMNTVEVVRQLKADSVGRRLREPLNADNILAKVKAKHCI